MLLTLLCCLGNALLHVRVVNQSDMEQGRVILQIDTASASLHGNRSSYNATGDSAEFILNGLAAALDATFTVTPATVYEAGVCFSFSIAQARYVGPSD